MSHVTEYIQWRGDIPFEECGLNEVDNLILCLLSYVDLDGILPEREEEAVTLREAAKEYFFVRNPPKSKPLGLIVPGEIVQLFRMMADAPRYADLRLFGYVNEISRERELQFSALTVKLTGDVYFAAIRGTDDTIVGWREDFNLSWMDEVPAQRMTADYLDRLGAHLPDTARLYVGGHSKGGNLAVWGAVHADATVRDRILLVYSNDGPGFSEGMLQSEAYLAMKSRIRYLVPQSSLVGLLLEHDETYEVIKSSQLGIFQHNGLSWEVMGGRFLREKSLSLRGRRNNVATARIFAMSRDERRIFTQTFFGILESTGAQTLTELNAGSLRNVVTMLRSVNDLDKETRELSMYILSRLFDLRPLLPPPPRRKKPKVAVRFFWQHV